jgi:hypothetical protein
VFRSLGDDSARRCAHETTEADVVPAFRRVIRQPSNAISDSWPSTHRQPYPGADLRARYRPSSSRRGRAGFINPSSARVNGSLIRLRQRETTWACLNLCLSIAGITGLMTCLSRPLYALIATSSECFHPSDLAETQAGIKGLCLVCVSGSDQSLLHLQPFLHLRCPRAARAGVQSCAELCWPVVPHQLCPRNHVRPYSWSSVCNFINSCCRF